MRNLLLVLLVSYFLVHSNASAISPFASRVAWSIGKRVEGRNKNESTTLRGGGSSSTAKTMTATQYETFKLLSGGVAGTVAACLTNPLEVLKTQLQQSRTQISPTRVAARIWKQDGFAGFFRGLAPTLVGIVPSRSAYFYAYGTAKSALQRYFDEGSPPNALIAGFLAGMAGNTLTNPIWMVRTRMQLFANEQQVQYTGYWNAITTIWKQEGIAGFYKGMSASYWGCTEGALQFVLYEQAQQRWFGQDRKTTKLEIFISAAVAKMIAAILTYPHEVARTRMREQAQAGGVYLYQGMWQTLRLIANQEGAAGLYRGMGVHLTKVVPNSAFMFLTYELVRQWLGEYTIVAVEENGVTRSSKKK